MALPTSRNTTYAPSSQLKSDDLNDIQDEIISLHEWRTREIPQSLEAWYTTGGVPDFINANGLEFTSNESAFVPAHGVLIGDAIDTIYLRYKSNITGSAFVSIEKGADGSTSLDLFSGLTHDNTYREISLSTTNVVALTRGQRLHLKFDGGSITAGTFYIVGWTIAVSVAP